MTRRWTGRKSTVTGRPIKKLGSSSDRTLDQTLAVDQPDARQQSPVKYREVPERRNYDWMRPVASDRTLAASDQLFVVPTVETTGRVRSGRFQHPVSSKKAGFRPQRLLSQWGL